MNEGHSSSEILYLDPVDWAAIIEARPNVLICGEPMFIDSFLGVLTGHCAAPIRRISESGALGLLFDIDDGTVVLEHADRYSESHQRGVLNWLANTGSAIQLITTTGQPLFDLVEQRQFLDSLFYRINTVYLELSCPADGTVAPWEELKHRIH